jgi:hypothetical protein
MQYADWQDRVIVEKDELDQKLAKLRTFLNTAGPVDLVSETEWERLKRQERAMSDYSQVLGERIAAF